jgi:hypothetical protein
MWHRKRTSMQFPEAWERISRRQLLLDKLSTRIQCHSTDCTFKGQSFEVELTQTTKSCVNKKIVVVVETTTTTTTAA